MAAQRQRRVVAAAPTRRAPAGRRGAAAARRPQAQRRWIAPVLVVVALVGVFVVGRATAGGGEPAPHDGATRLVAGVPQGFEHSARGAAAAAAAYVRVLGSADMLSTGGRARIVEQVMTAEYAPRYAEQAGAAAETISSTPLGRAIAAGTPTMLFGSPLAYKLQSYAADAATLRVWMVSVAGNATTARPQAEWSVYSMQLRWDRDDWRVGAFAPADGLVPVSTKARPTAAAEFVANAGAMTPYRDAP